eukprot:UN3510
MQPASCKVPGSSAGASMVQVILIADQVAKPLGSILRILLAGGINVGLASKEPTEAAGAPITDLSWLHHVLLASVPLVLPLIERKAVQYTVGHGVKDEHKREADAHADNADTKQDPLCVLWIKRLLPLDLSDSQGP